MASTEELAIKIEKIDSRSKTNTERLDKMEERQDHMDQLVASVAILATEQKQLKEDVTEIKADVKALAHIPGKRWEGLVQTMIAALVAGVVGFMLAQIGVL
ncbi:MAG: hypothetical protein K0S60_678 [Evtepia sp.]|jgi:predicted nuclease with TOPRIM domain|nr:hypothetical protein [Evtepia sp.]